MYHRTRTFHPSRKRERAAYIATVLRHAAVETYRTEGGSIAVQAITRRDRNA